MKQRIEEIIEKRAKEIIATRRKVYVLEYVKESKKKCFKAFFKHIWEVWCTKQV